MNMEHSEPAQCLRDWAGRDLIDILSHHVCPSLWLSRDSLVCRLVCSSWRVAFAPRALTVHPEALASSKETITAAARRISQFNIEKADLSLLQWLRDDVILAPGSMSNLYALTIQMPSMSIEEATIIAEILANLKQSRLRKLTISISDQNLVSDDVFRIIVNAIADTEAPIRDLNLSEFPVKPSTSADLFSALSRGPRTLRKLKIHNDTYGESLAADFFPFLKNNQSIRKIDGFSLINGSDAAELQALLAVDHHLEYLSLIGCGHQTLKSIFSSLRINRRLRKLRVGRYDVADIDFSFVIDCLCENDSIQKLDLEDNDRVVDLASQLNRLFSGPRSSLRRFKLRCIEGRREDFTGFFQGGVRMNSTLTHLDVSYVPLNFIVQLAECIIDGKGLMGLEKIGIGYTSMGAQGALMLSTAALCLPRLKNFDLFIVDCGSEAAEHYSNMIEKSVSLEIVSFYTTKFGSAGLIRISDAVIKSRSSIYEIALGGEAHTDEALLAVCDMVSKKQTLEYLDFSGTSIPIKFKPNFEAALMQNDKMYRMEVGFVKEEGGDEDSMDLKNEMVKAFFNATPFEKPTEEHTQS